MPTSRNWSLAIVAICIGPTVLAALDEKGFSEQLQRELVAEVGLEAQSCFTSACGPLACNDSSRLSATLVWGAGILSSHDASYEVDRIQLTLEPRISFESLDKRSIAAELRYRGTLAAGRSGRQYTIEQDGVGEFSGRSSYFIEGGELQFLLPVLFRPLDPEEMPSSAVLRFGCDAFLRNCDRPRLVFASYLEQLGRTSIGLPLEPPGAAPLPAPSAGFMVPKCCFDPFFFRCTCRQPAVSCSSSTGGVCPVEILNGCTTPVECFCSPGCPPFP